MAISFSFDAMFLISAFSSRNKKTNGRFHGYSSRTLCFRLAKANPRRKVFPVVLLSSLARTQLSDHVGPLTSISTRASHNVCSVEDYGAVNGHPSIDFGPLFADAWADCKGGGLVWIPYGEWIMQTAVTLDDAPATAIQLDGTIYRYAAMTSDEMILIKNGKGVEIFSGNSQGAI